MKWSEEKVKRLHDLAFDGKTNQEIAKALGVGINEVYAKRSQLGITIDKVKSAKSEATMNPEFEKAAQDMDDRAAFLAKQGLIRLLGPAIIQADNTVKELALVDEGRAVTISYKDGAVKRAYIEGDSLLAVIAEITHRCLYGGGAV